MDGHKCTGRIDFTLWRRRTRRKKRREEEGKEEGEGEEIIWEVDVVGGGVLGEIGQRK